MVNGLGLLLIIKFILEIHLCKNIFYNRHAGRNRASSAVDGSTVTQLITDRAWIADLFDMMCNVA